MIVISLVLVVVSAVSLLVGGLFRDDLVLIYASIGAALAAAVFLGIGVLQGTRRARPATAATLPGEDLAGQPATWQGAGWAAGAQSVLSRDDEVDETTRLDRPAAQPETPVVGAPVAAPVAEPGAAPAPSRAASPWAPPPPPPPPTGTPRPSAPAAPPAAPRGAPPPPPPPA